MTTIADNLVFAPFAGEVSAVKLATHFVEKPWGRDAIPALFGAPAGKRIGEMWFDGAEGDAAPLLVKYIFTSERLSIQVHPNDAQAQAQGLRRGKQECWYVLDCAPGAVLGIGLTRTLSPEEFVAACADGTIETLIDWKPVKPGDFYFIPAGTVHAIGANIMLAEIQQHSDVTYRLYDYGRPRDLHLDEGRAVSLLAPYDRPCLCAPYGNDRALLDRNDAPFSVRLVHWEVGATPMLDADGPAWFLPLAGSGAIGGGPFAQGQCWRFAANTELRIDTACDALIAVA
jgi:mannose-6-phosphate isomerase